VEFRTGAPVTELVVRNGRVEGVVLENGDDIPARVVVSGHDAGRTFLDLVDPVHLDPDFIHTVQHLRYRGVAAKINLALSELPQFVGMKGPEDLVGTIVLCDNLVQLERAYDAAKYGRVSDRLVAEVTVPSVTDPSLAPDGAHVMSVWIQYAPFHLRDGVWDAESRESLGDAALALIAQYAPNVPAAVVGREIFTPLDMQAQFGLTEGHLYQGELGLDQILFMRPVPGWSHYQTPIGGLYMCGRATHPAGGIMGQSGLLAAREILRERH
jgi:phytoene dehydrogenase-like protein